jgi:hypothetical protein
MSALLTSDGGSLLWPTPTASAGERGGRGELLHAIKAGNPKHRREMLPTPSVNDSKNVAGPSQMQRHSPGLGALVGNGMLATPTRTANQLSMSMSMSKWKGCANLQRIAGGSGGQLNPLFVEWMMGFPTGWTNLEL